MKLGDIKIEALKLMFTTYDENIGIEELPYLIGSDAYGSYLVAMTGSINRCFADLENRGVLPVRSFTLIGGDAGEKKGVLRFDLQDLIQDFYSLERLIYERGTEYEDKNLTYRTEGNTLVLPWFDKNRETVRVLYRPRIARIFSYTDDQTEIGIPNHIAVFIPYWIKGELFRDDEPNEAGEARNWYEAAMAQLIEPPQRQEGTVRTVYSMTEV